MKIIIYILLDAIGAVFKRFINFNLNYGPLHLSNSWNFKVNALFNFLTPWNSHIDSSKYWDEKIFNHFSLLDEFLHKEPVSSTHFKIMYLAFTKIYDYSDAKNDYESIKDFATYDKDAKDIWIKISDIKLELIFLKYDLVGLILEGIENLYLRNYDYPEPYTSPVEPDRLDPLGLRSVECSEDYNWVILDFVGAWSSRFHEFSAQEKKLGRLVVVSVVFDYIYNFFIITLVYTYLIVSIILDHIANFCWNFDTAYRRFKNVRNGGHWFAIGFDEEYYGFKVAEVYKLSLLSTIQWPILFAVIVRHRLMCWLYSRRSFLPIVLDRCIAIYIFIIVYLKFLIWFLSTLLVAALICLSSIPQVVDCGVTGMFLMDYKIYLNFVIPDLVKIQHIFITLPTYLIYPLLWLKSITVQVIFYTYNVLTSPGFGSILDIWTSSITTISLVLKALCYYTWFLIVLYVEAFTWYWFGHGFSYWYEIYEYSPGLLTIEYTEFSIKKYLVFWKDHFYTIYYVIFVYTLGKYTTVYFAKQIVNFNNLILDVLNLIKKFIIEDFSTLAVYIFGGHHILLYVFALIFLAMVLGFRSLQMLVLLRIVWFISILFEFIIVTLKLSQLNLNVKTMSTLHIVSSLHNTRDQGLIYDTAKAGHSSTTLLPYSGIENISTTSIDALTELYTHKGALFLIVVGNVFSFLTVFIFLLCAFLLRDSTDYMTMMLMLIIEYMLLRAFTSQDLLEFYTFFESVLIPMFMLIVRKGGGPRKVISAFYMFLYTTALSAPMLYVLMLTKEAIGTLNIAAMPNLLLNDVSYLSHTLWISLFLAFSVKVPIMPFHLWLPEAHVEASTEASIILASLLLKLGLFGFACILLPIMPQLSVFYAPVAKTLFLLSLVYSSKCAVVQQDMKKIVAYSSIAHMNIALLALFSFNALGLISAIYIGVSHGIVSSGLFLLIGALYDRYDTRNIAYFGGLARVKPIFSIFFFIFNASNMGLPGTCSFVGEALAAVAIYDSNKILCLVVLLTSIISAVYSMLMFSKVCFGELDRRHISLFVDLNSTEIIVLSILTFSNIALGIKPQILLNLLNFSILL